MYRSLLEALLSTIFQAISFNSLKISFAYMILFPISFPRSY